jgi:hypothetical protein
LEVKEKEKTSLLSSAAREPVPRSVENVTEVFAWNEAVEALEPETEISWNEY